MDLSSEYITDNLNNHVPSFQSAFNPRHTYIYMDNTGDVSIDNGNTFEGMNVSQVGSTTVVDDYPEVFAIWIRNKTFNLSYINLIEDNTLDKAFNAEVRLEESSNNEIRDNTFSSGSTTRNYGRGIYSTGSSNQMKITGNVFDHLLVGIDLYSTVNIKIKDIAPSTGNTFDEVSEGIICHSCGLFDISSNTFNGSSSETGVQVYRDNYSSLNTSRIGCNTFNDQKYGVMISPVMNPLMATSTSSNQLSGGPAQNVAILENTFNDNLAAIVGSDYLINHYGANDPSNTFNSSVDWDIVWVRNGSSGFAFTYYNTSFNTAPSLPTYTLNGVSCTSANWNTTHIQPTSPWGTIYCGFYDPFNTTPPPAMRTGISEAPSTSIAVSPNPAGDFVNISNENKEKQDYELYDLTGRLIRSGTIDSGGRLELQNLHKGMYLLKVMLPSGSSMSSKLLKN
jgi:hypothetical protein